MGPMGECIQTKEDWVLQAKDHDCCFGLSLHAQRFGGAKNVRVSVDQTEKRHCYIFKDIPKEAYFKGRRIRATTVVRSICQETGGTCEERARSDHLASAGKTAMQGDPAGTGYRRAIFRHVPDEGT